MSEFLQSGLGRLCVGVVLASLLYVLRRFKEGDFDLLGEAQLLVFPAAGVGISVVLAGGSYMGAAMTSLTAMAVALGFNSRLGSK